MLSLSSRSLPCRYVDGFPDPRCFGTELAAAKIKLIELKENLAMKISRSSESTFPECKRLWKQVLDLESR